ncbi:hypothetical protein [Oceanicoccus sp. KOV_DT_Chl]|uniref:hypothetical protein n=1 Tax=Oceanicoccus sp. KOV_DT_Chl TaxID=1904639 RepID=UPI000C79FC5D|nr:hypothetical protein [Oceanicoccus sp. KOV_DT_Chl]
MDMISNTPAQYSSPQFSFSDQVALVSECVLMAGAIKRHYDDALLITDAVENQPLIEEMSQVIEASNELLVDLSDSIPLNSFEVDELKMVWNRLHYLVAITYQGAFIPNAHYC